MFITPNIAYTVYLWNNEQWNIHKQQISHCLKSLENQKIALRRNELFVGKIYWRTNMRVLDTLLLLLWAGQDRDFLN